MSWVCYFVLYLWTHIITDLILMPSLRNGKQERDLFCSCRKQFIRRKIVFHQKRQVKWNAYDRLLALFAFILLTRRQESTSRVCSKLLSITNRLAIPFTGKLSSPLLISRKFFDWRIIQLVINTISLNNPFLVVLLVAVYIAINRIGT